MSIKEMFKEADIGLSQYKNIIGVGVIIMFIVFSGVFLFTYSQERKIAEDCGFINEKIKCICSKEAWDIYNNAISWNLNISEGLNRSYDIDLYGEKENSSSIEK